MFEISAAISSFTAIKQIGRAIYEAKVDTDVKEKVREILDRLGDAQDVLYGLRDELLTLQGENANLRQQLKDAADWEAKAREYTLQAATGGAVVLHHNSVLGLFACPVCANDRKLVPLQDTRNLHGTYLCPACKASYLVKPATAYQAPRIDYGPRRVL